MTIGYSEYLKAPGVRCVVPHIINHFDSPEQIAFVIGDKLCRINKIGYVRIICIVLFGTSFISVVSAPLNVHVCL